MTTLIIGGTHGIGRAVAQMLPQDNQLHIISRHGDDDPIAGASYHNLDILSDELPDIDDVAQIVYCPGSINLRPVQSLKIDDFRSDFEINVIGAVRAVQKYYRTIKKQEGASIVFFSTVAVQQGMPFHTSVAAAKGAVEGLTRSLAAEMAPLVRVNCIAPTMTDTPLAASILKNDQARDNIAERHPLKRILDAEEVASMAAYLLSPAARGITGQVIGIDAGMGSLKL